MTDIYDNIDEMIDLCHKKIETLIQLKKAFRIADLLGIPPKELKQAVSTRLHNTGSTSIYNPKPWLSMVYSVRVGDGEWHDFALKDVPHDLWPDDMRQAWVKWKKINTVKNKAKE